MDGGKHEVHLHNTLLIPTLSNSLFSVKTVNRLGFSALFRPYGVLIENPNQSIIAESEEGGNLYDLRIVCEPVMASTAHLQDGITLDILHKRLGHPNLSTLQQMIRKGLVKGINVQDVGSNTSLVCNACIKAKMTSAPFNTGHKCAVRRLQCVHSDLCGEFEHPTLGGNCYFATLIDDMSGMIWVRPLKLKADFVDWFIKMDAIFLNQYGTHIGTLCTDNRGEYVNHRLKEYCNQHGILLKLTVPHTPQQNGVAERANRTLTEWMRVIMKDTDCPLALWGEAVSMVAYCLNRTATLANGGVMPIQAFDGSTPDISHMRIFYSDMYIH